MEPSLSSPNAPTPDQRTGALIVAAGRGSRAQTADDRAPKQYALIGGQPVLAHTLKAFCTHPSIALIQVVIHKDDRALYDQTLAALDRDLLARLQPPVTGGATRQASVLQGLNALAKADPTRVLIHDAARPFVSPGTITRVVDALASHAGAFAAMPVTDTIRRRTDGGKFVTIARDHLWSAQTPQGFDYRAIHQAHQDAAAAGRNEFTDDAAVAEWAGLTAQPTAGNGANTKITTAQDLLMADDIARRQTFGQSSGQPRASGKPHGNALPREGAQPNETAQTRKAGRVTGPNDHLTPPDIRTGSGFDVHRLVPGPHVWLCGVKLAHEMTLAGHSDADVGLHALTDALLGAIGDGDIGTHFPPSDPQWKGAASDRFLADAARRVRAKGGIITNVDVTLLCEAPKIGPHREAMRARLAAILAIDVTRVSVKATTTERLGFTGRGEGIAAMATATISLSGTTKV